MFIERERHEKFRVRDDFLSQSLVIARNIDDVDCERRVVAAQSFGENAFLCLL
jgi:hypothetical protein